MYVSGVLRRQETVQTSDGNNQGDLFNPDPEGSRQARDAALEQVGNNSGGFMDRALGAIDLITEGQTLTGEEIRFRLMQEKIAPHHHNAWGALISAAVRRGLIRETGRWVAMRSTKSKARRTPEYWRTGVPYEC